MSAGATDLEVNCAVRRVFIRHWVDLGRISFRTQRGNVTLRGSLERLPGSDQPLTVQTVEQMFMELQRIHGVNRVITDLSNWERTSNGWRNTRGEAVPTSKPAIRESPAPGAARSFVVTGGSADVNR